MGEKRRGGEIETGRYEKGWVSEDEHNVLPELLLLVCSKYSNFDCSPCCRSV